MKYTPPVDVEGEPYYVPIVSKNKDTLVGYINGLNTSKDIVNDVMDAMDIDIDVCPIDVILDSTRFNDILENNKRESEMTKEELDEYIESIIEGVTAKLQCETKENDIYKHILRVECSCGFGYYSWDNIEDIPDENFICKNCGKILIHYTGAHGHEYEFDGGNNDRQKN